MGILVGCQEVFRLFKCSWRLKGEIWIKCREIFRFHVRFLGCSWQLVGEILSMHGDRFHIWN